MKVRRQMSEGRPGGNARKKKKDNLNNRMALVGVTMVVLSLAVAVHIKGIDLKEKDKSYSIREENLEAQVAKEEERAKQLEEYRVYVQTKQYIEKVAKEKLGLVNRNEILLKPSNPIRLAAHLECLGITTQGSSIPGWSRKMSKFSLILLRPFDKYFLSLYLCMAFIQVRRDICLKRRTLHRDMADVNVYTARRLKSMALSLGGLAQAFADEIGGQGHLTKEDGLAAMQTAASAVCGDCTRCNLYYGSRRDDSYYLYYLLRTFEQKGKIDLEDMPRLFHEICSQREAYLRELNRSLGRATMNLGWKNRFLESRDAVIVQFRELAAILEEFSNQMEQAADVTASWEEMLSGILRRSHLRVDNMLVLLQYSTAKISRRFHIEAPACFLTLRSVNGRCMTARDVAELLGRAIAGSHWSVAKDSKSLITRNAATFRFVEEGKYRMVYGMACSPREGEPISGDTCSADRASGAGDYEPVGRYGKRQKRQRGQREGH